MKRGRTPGVKKTRRSKGDEKEGAGSREEEDKVTGSKGGDE